MAKIVIRNNKTILQIESIAKIYPRIDDISIIILPSLLQPNNTATELLNENVSLYNKIETMVGIVIKVKITIIITPTPERKYSILAPAVRNVSPMLPPVNGIIFAVNILANLLVKLSDLLASSD